MQLIDYTVVTFVNFGVLEKGKLFSSQKYTPSIVNVNPLIVGEEIFDELIF